MKQLKNVLSVFAVLALLATVNSFAAKIEMHTSSQFQGPKANTGTVTHYVENGKSMLKVSEDFKVPDTPAPTWRVVDSKGNIYTGEVDTAKRIQKFLRYGSTGCRGTGKSTVGGVMASK